MIYSKFKNLKLSSLGMGTMRLPTVDGKDAHIDVEKSREIFDYAIKNGVNYFDTAWGYHGGNSELVVGELLSAYPRDSYFLATKFPGYDASNIGKNGEIFEKQLEKLRTDYFDFYLVHCLSESNIEAYLDEKLGTIEYLIEQKKNGRIKHLGLSVHCSLETLIRFLDKYGRHMEFCQVQMNYIDYYFQDAKAKLEELEKRNIDVWVMEPIRGGMLANLKGDEKACVESIREGVGQVEMAFRYLQGFEQIKVILSGMSSIEQIKENVRIFSEQKGTTEEENEKLYTVAAKLTGNNVPCTACKYCVSHCPKDIQIPDMIELYNKSVFKGSILKDEIEAVPLGKRPNDCIGCRSCEAVCPQQIEISEVMTKFSEKIK